MTKHTITLSRAHKITERLASVAGVAKATALSLSATATLMGFSAGQVDRMKENSCGTMEQLKLYTRLMAALTAARAAIGIANTTHGIGALLAQIEGNKKIMSVLAAVVDGQGMNGSNVHLSELDDYKTVGGAESPRHSYVQAVILCPAQVEELQSQSKALERKNFALSDELADLNGKTVELVMEDDIAELMGLVKS